MMKQIKTIFYFTGIFARLTSDKIYGEQGNCDCGG